MCHAFVVGTIQTGAGAPRSVKASLVVLNKPDIWREEARAASSRLIRFPAPGPPSPSLSFTPSDQKQILHGASKALWPVTTGDRVVVVEFKLYSFSRIDHMY